MTAAPTVCIAGAGVFGLACALALARRGASVLLVDPAPAGSNASSVAAGLLAPVSEAIFDPVAAAHYPLLAAAYDSWPLFARSSAISVVENGTVVAPPFAAMAAVLGASLSPHPFGGLIRSESLVCDPARALLSLKHVFLEAGGRFEARSLSSNDARNHDRLILATGPGAAMEHAPELGWLSPVKGQIAALPHGPGSGQTVRWPGGYLAPQPSGARVGATMEAGRADTFVEPQVIKGLIESALAHVPDLDVRGAYGQAGVRMQTLDGLPLVGPCTAPGLLLAVGARRNGWLLAPLVASIIAAYCMGEDPGAWARPLHPGRFG